ncbi:thioredoxin domain-containing protein [Altibacter sp. HG106]|uniref:thioredoxin domain-containing protein n=1 Tax=Altibacter sp. HG106 TaxID=3023937 RepID=UPI00234FEBFB|nr:thioredoxin domain-containing protein [Altibacter sp. HG106]MDC7994634.1 thioredoxin domain-containing protein [Altibacter sp. HG106]
MRYYFLLGLLLSLSGCKKNAETTLEQHDYTNELIHETSPYLLQHAHNPVNWRPWNETTLQKARDENKLMIISIGYAACHWCHVMERETFEDSTAAAVMNEHFISVKVDREERPDVDQIYINAVQLMKGTAGWPLNVITLPDGKPVWGGTYFQKEEWINSIQEIQQLYENDPQKMQEYANRLAEGIKSIDLIERNSDAIDYSDYDTESLMTKWKQRFDQTHGGYTRAPKFMMPNHWEFLLRKAVRDNDSALLDHVTFTLDKMAYGGIYDHIGGGFSRYSTDIRWHVPHFEKMLYDNAQLVTLYSEAYQVTKKPLYQEVVAETLDFIEREMTHESGAFYSSLDADSETTSGELEEGAYYVYSEEELKKVLGPDFSMFANYYNVNETGYWEEEEAYVLLRLQSDEAIATRFGITPETLQQKKSGWKKKLFDYRNQRVRPRLDDKSLTSWNGLMMSGYISAYKAFQDPAYLVAAQNNANFIKNQQLQANGALYHTYKDGMSSINGYLEDYAAVIQGYIDLYEVTLDSQWLALSKQMAEYTFTHFHDDASGMFYFTSDEDKALVSRSFEYRDNVIPASNSIMAHNLFLLSHYYDVPKYAETAKQMLHNVQPELEKYPDSFSNWIDLLANYQSSFYELVVVGPEAPQKIKELSKTYLPNVLLAGSTKKEDDYLLEGRFVEGETYLYVCVNNTCKLPMKEVSQALTSIKE